MLMCATCSSRWDRHVGPTTTVGGADCLLCGGKLLELVGVPLDGSEPVHADVARVLREHLLGVGA